MGGVLYFASYGLSNNYSIYIFATGSFDSSIGVNIYLNPLIINRSAIQFINFIVSLFKNMFNIGSFNSADSAELEFNLLITISSLINYRTELPRLNAIKIFKLIGLDVIDTSRLNNSYVITILLLGLN